MDDFPFDFPDTSVDEIGLNWEAFMHCGPPLFARTRSRHKTRSGTSRFYYLDLDHKTVLSLRLVSREWRSSINVLLRQHKWWWMSIDNPKDMQKLADGIFSVDRKDSRFTNEIVRCLQIPIIYDALDFRRGFRCRPEQGPRPWKYEDDDYKHARGQGRRNFNPFTGDLKKNIDFIFDGLSNVEALSLTFPGAEAEYNQRRREASVDYYDMQVLDGAMSFFPSVLESPAFRNLADIRVQLPCTYHVTMLSRGVNQEARVKLRHVSISIADSTGSDGSNAHSIYYDPDFEPGYEKGTHIDPIIPLSNVQTKLPNKEHQDKLWEFVGSCPNLDSLSIRGTHYLDLDQLHWQKAPDSRGLRVLSLARVWASVPSILALMSASTASDPARLRRLHLDDVKIRPDGGNWSDVLDHL